MWSIAGLRKATPSHKHGLSCGLGPNKGWPEHLAEWAWPEWTGPSGIRDWPDWDTPHSSIGVHSGPFDKDIFQCMSNRFSKLRSFKRWVFDSLDTLPNCDAPWGCAPIHRWNSVLPWWQSAHLDWFNLILSCVQFHDVKTQHHICSNQPRPISLACCFKLFLNWTSNHFPTRSHPHVHRFHRHPKNTFVSTRWCFEVRCGTSCATFFFAAPTQSQAELHPCQTPWSDASPLVAFLAPSAYRRLVAVADCE